MFWADQAAVLERVAAGHPLGEVLADIVRMIEKQAEGMFCSLLLLDDRGTIRHGAAPNLPADLVRLLDGQPIGACAGSCGTAAYRRERVIVEDIASHPYWAAYRHLALPFGLRACWSSPIFSAEREVLGTFAMYYREPRGPTPAEISWVDAATHLAAVVISSHRAKRALELSEAHARRLARLYSMSNAVNEAIVRERDVSALYQTTCALAVEHGLARLVWIGVTDRETRRVVPVAHAGVGLEDAARLHLDLLDERARPDPAAAAVRAGAPLICDDLAGAPHPPPGSAGQEVATGHGLRACAVIPLRPAAETEGLLVLHADEAGAFGEDETAVLARLAEDISFGVASARTAAALRRSEERLRAIIEHTPDVAIQWYDQAGRLIFYNQASRRLFGWTEGAALGRSLLEIGFWDSGEEARFAAERARAATGEYVAPTQFRFRRPDGGEGYLHSTVFKIPLSESEGCYVCMDVDLTDHHQMQAALRAGETLRALIYDCVSDVIFYLAVEGEGRYRFRSVNRAFLRATGLAEDQVVGRLVDEVIPASSLALVKRKYAEAVASGGRVVWDEVSTYPSGTRYGEVTVVPVAGADGRCTHLVGTVHDVTERRQAEQERRQIEAGLHQAQRLQALGTLAGGIAHDFNNILAGIYGNLDAALARLKPGDEVHDSLVAVSEAAQRATSLVRQILTFARRSEPRRERLELRPVVEEALKLLRVGLGPGVRLETSFAADVPAVFGDSTQVHQVVMNVVTNAAQAIGQAGGCIGVSLTTCLVPAEGRSDLPELASGRYARLAIKDDGPGMDQATLRRAFEPFFTTKLPGQGTGLGLSVVHGILKAHGGAVTATSQPGRGATFELYFPAAPPAVDAPGVDQAAGRPGQRVLLVEDDEALVFLARRAFSRLGHQVFAQPGPSEALQELQRHPADFDVVVADVARLEPDGPVLLRELRKLRPELKVIVTTTHQGPEDMARAQELGVAEILARPQSFEDLARLVELHR